MMRMIGGEAARRRGSSYYLLLRIVAVDERGMIAVMFADIGNAIEFLADPAGASVL